MSIDISKTSYHAAISHGVTLIENGPDTLAEVEKDFLEVALAWVWDTSVSIDLAKLYTVNEYTRELIVTLIAGRVKFETLNQHHHASSLEKIWRNVTQTINLKNPPGKYFKIEELDSFTPLDNQLSASFINNLSGIIKMRLKNLEEGRTLNHGMPYTQEERDELTKRINNGQSIDELSEVFQRSRLSIMKRLEELDLLPSSAIPDTSHINETISVEESVQCESCGEEIPAGRLQAVPNTRYCVNCKDEDESGLERGTVFPPVPQGMRKNCPRCDQGIVVVYQNKTDLNFFLGCSRFPNCHWASDLK